MTRRTTTILALWASLWASASAQAQPPPSLELEAPPGCPDRAELEAAIAARGATPGADHGVGLRARIVADGEGFEGTLQLSAPDSAEPGMRRVRGRSCAEVVDALAAVAAIALAERAQGRPAAFAAPTPATPVEAPPAVAAPVTEPAPPEPSEPAAPAPAAAPRDPRTLHAEESLVTPMRLHRELPVEQGVLSLDRSLDLTLMGGAAFGLVPGQVVPRFDLMSVQGSLLSLPGEGPSYLASPLWVARLTVFGPTSHDSAGSSTDLFGLGAGGGTCTALAHDRGGLTALFCGELGFNVVSLRTRGNGVVDEQSKTRAYGNVGLFGHVQYAISPGLHLALRAGIDSTTYAWSAERDDGSEIFHGTRWGRGGGFDGYGLSGYVELGLGVRF